MAFANGSQSNVLLRVSKNDPKDELQAFRVEFRGAGVGSDQFKSVLQMVSLDDTQIAMLSLGEVRMVNVKANLVAGLFTDEREGEVFGMRDLFHAKNGSNSNLYISYQRLNPQQDKLYFVVDKVGVRSSLQLSGPDNVFYGLAQSEGSRRNFLSVKVAVSEANQLLTACVQAQGDNTQTKSIFFQ